VREGYVPRGQKLLHYVLIEDIHDNPEAQGKIAAILLYAHHHWGCPVAFVEGAFGPVGPPPFPLFTAVRGEQSVNELLRRGLFSGGELAAALASQEAHEEQAPFHVVGMDDPDLYRHQLEIYEELSGIQDKALERLNGYVGSGETRAVRFWRRLIALRMTPSDYRAYRLMGRPKLSDPLLARAIGLGENYYQLTDLRSEHFAQRTRERQGNAPCLLVLGGFHVSVLARMLRERKESFVVLAPRVTSSGLHARYQDCLLKSLEVLNRFPAGSPYGPSVSFLRLNLERKQIEH
jgi:hypothetical protein